MAFIEDRPPPLDSLLVLALPPPPAEVDLGDSAAAGMDGGCGGLLGSGIDPGGGPRLGLELTMGFLPSNRWFMAADGWVVALGLADDDDEAVALPRRCPRSLTLLVMAARYTEKIKQFIIR